MKANIRTPIPRPAMATCLLLHLWLAASVCQGQGNGFWWPHDNWVWQHQPWWVTSAPTSPVTPRPPTLQPWQQKHQACQRLVASCQARAPLVTRLVAGLGGTAPQLTINQDLLNSFDDNGDGCITRQEYENRLVGRGYSLDYARFHFVNGVERGRGLDSTLCPGAMSIRALANTTSPVVPTADLVSNNNTMYMVVFCEELLSRYETNCDCKQLPAACQSSRLASLPACANYRVTTQGRTGCPFDLLRQQPTTANTPSREEIQRKCASMQFGPGNADLIRALCRLVNESNGTSNSQTGR